MEGEARILKRASGKGRDEILLSVGPTTRHASNRLFCSSLPAGGQVQPRLESFISVNRIGRCWV